MWAGRTACWRPPGRACRAARPRAAEAVDVVLDALAIRVMEGYAAAAPALRRAVDAVLALEVDDDIGRWLWLTGSRAGAVAALELWDADAWHALADAPGPGGPRYGRPRAAAVRAAVPRPQSRARRGPGRGRAGDRGGPRYRRGDRYLAGGLHGDDARGLARAGGADVRVDRAPDAGGERARDRPGDPLRGLRGGGALQRDRPLRRRARCGPAAFEHDHLGYTPFVVPEVAEAASRTGDAALLQAAADWMAERTAVTPTDWALGMEARVRALASDGDAAEALYRESIERLARTRVRVELARAHLLYGEWLRREGRRVDAREQLRVAREQLLAMGADGFAERARHELLATGEKVRKRSDDTRDELTPQEEHIARLAREGGRTRRSAPSSSSARAPSSGT